MTLTNINLNNMNPNKQPMLKANTFGSKNRKRGFSMIEIIMVIGILGILIGVGATNFVKQTNTNRLNTTSRMIASTIQQARQMAIAMRQNRRVVIDAGALSGFDTEISGARIDPIRIWIEGKRCEQLRFDDAAVCVDRRGDLPNSLELTDPETLPDNVMIGLDTFVPGIDKPNIFYIEFNPRGSVSKVYFQGEERSTPPNNIEPLIFLVSDNEVFRFKTNTGDYTDAMGSLPEWLPRGRGEGEDQEVREDFERYKINTIEVIRLTGRSRTYDYAVLGPFPLDHPPESPENEES